MLFELPDDHNGGEEDEERGEEDAEEDEQVELGVILSEEQPPRRDVTQLRCRHVRCDVTTTAASEEDDEEAVGALEVVRGVRDLDDESLAQVAHAKQSPFMVERQETRLSFRPRADESHLRSVVER